jgi:NAD+ diphosphatase
MHNFMQARPNPYSGGALDRAAHLREDDAWIASAIADPASRFTLFWRGRPLLAVGDVPRAMLPPPPGLEAPFVFLGLVEEVPIFALDLSAAEAPPEVAGGAFTDLRGLTALLPETDASILATARGMLHWRATHIYCPACGGALAPVRAGWVLHCGQCGAEHFPRTDAAVIMLVVRDGKLLLGQSHKFPLEKNLYSTLAGFVEPGESLEDAVRREVMEETGVRVGSVSYHSSQPWPFPASLMLGYYAEGVSKEIVLDATEMRDARWFTRAEIVNHVALGFGLPPHDSIARRLIEDWLSAAP